MNRRAQSHCPVSHMLDIFGDKWTLLIMRDMLIGHKRHYRDFAGSGEGIATNILADRLRMLVERGIVTREDDPANGTQAIYRPTAKAQALMPVLDAMTEWGLAYGPDHVRAPANWRPRTH
jgi:DNA-binding HxlR family transcriptional regulator